MVLIVALSWLQHKNGPRWIFWAYPSKKWAGLRAGTVCSDPKHSPAQGAGGLWVLAEPGRCSKPRGAAGTRQADSSRWRLPPSFGGWKPRPCHSGLKPGGGAGDGRLGRPVQGSPARKPHPPGPQTPAGRSLAAAALRRAARREARGGAVWRYDGSGCAARSGQRRAHARPRRHFGGPARWCFHTEESAAAGVAVAVFVGSGVNRRGRRRWRKRWRRWRWS